MMYIFEKKISINRPCGPIMERIGRQTRDKNKMGRQLLQLFRKKR